MLLLWFHSIPFLLRTLPRADMESAPTVCQSRCILPAANVRRGGGTPPYVLPEKGNVGRPALWPRSPFAPPCTIRAIAPHTPGTPRGTAPQRKASLVKGRCRACEAEGFLPVCGCDSVQGIARRNPSVRLRRPPLFDKGGRTVKKGAFTLGPLCEGAPPAGGGGENCTITRNISGYGKVLSLRPFGAPPSQREAFLRPNLKLHFKFHSCKIWQSVLQSHSIPF